MTHKKCTKCGEEKALDAFGSNRSCSDGRQSHCKECKRKYRTTHPEKVRASNRKYREANPEKARERARKWRVANPEKFKEYRAKRYENDLQYRLECQLRGRLGMALKGSYKNGSAVSDLGCSIPEFKTRLEAQFKPGMTWANHGVHGWHIDHIKPLASFDLTDREQFLKAVHFSNLQPLWAKENMHKGADLPSK